MRNWFIGAIGICIIVFLLTFPYAASNWFSPTPTQVVEKEQASNWRGSQNEVNNQSPAQLAPQRNIVAGEQSPNARAPTSSSEQNPGEVAKAQNSAGAAAKRQSAATPEEHENSQVPAVAPLQAKSPRLSEHNGQANQEQESSLLTAQRAGQVAQAQDEHVNVLGAAATQAEIATGRQVYRKCQACHSLEPGKNLVGPSLAGIIGRKAGTEQGFNYSSAMKSSNLTWDAKTLNDYLADPQKVVPGNRMPFPGLKSETDRADVIAFLSASASPAAIPGPQASKAPPQNQPVFDTQPSNQQNAPATAHAMPDLTIPLISDQPVNISEKPLLENKLGELLHKQP